MPAKRKNTRKQTDSRKKANSSLNLVLKRLDKFDKRFDALDRQIDAVDQKVDAVRQETAAEFKAVRGEIAQVRQETTMEFKTVRNEMAQGFANMGQQMTAEIQSVRNDMVKYYSQLDGKIDENDARYQQRHNQLLTGMDVMARNYEQFVHARDIIDAEHRDLKKDVETLKKRDMEKAAAIDKIEKEIDKLKTA
jgi:predicted  nucleic acid-binding Zn-ribbon protein